MPRITPVNPDSASGKAKELLDATTKKNGRTLNLLATMANAPAVLEGYLNLAGSLSGGSLSPKIREQIAIAVAAANSCEYCLAAHTAIGKGAGVSEEDLAGAQTGEVSDPKAVGVLRLAGVVVDKAGRLSDQDLQRAREDGLTDAEIIETTANVALNILTNYINNVAHTD
jgi:uncharacterized peroxidase-related enzyme